MKFGLFYLFSEFGDVPQDRIFREILEEIDYGEELGFDSVWLPEHHFSVYGTLGNPMTLASAIAQRTKRLRIGTAVMVLPFQHPLRVAEDAALVDALSGGRLLLGVGRGYQVPEFDVFDIPQGASRAMFMESLGGHQPRHLRAGGPSRLQCPSGTQLYLHQRGGAGLCDVHRKPSEAWPRPGQDGPALLPEDLRGTHRRGG
jgi:alkanesulfonate monooxygenase SsuD/methylene tetrahydromethanopterin reductase-like flavin-dependent oxidoreductase (luciferase family)